MHFRIEDKLEYSDDLPISAGDDVYMQRVSQVNLRKMLETVSISMEQELSRLYSQALSSELWSERNINLLSINNFQDYFEPLTGSIKIPGDIEDPAIRNFYLSFERNYIRGGTRETRAKSYYIAVDPDYKTGDEKLSVIERDLEACYKIIHVVSRAGLKGFDYLAYLGILDYVKQHTLTLFHVLTYPERFGRFDEGEGYYHFRDLAIRLIDSNVKAFYQGCLGQNFNSTFGSMDDLLDLRKLISYIRSQVRDYKQFTLQEVDHPLRLMTHVNGLLETYPDIDTVIPILSGGTQTSLMVREGYRLKRGVDLPSIFLPLSTHSAKINFGSTLNTDSLLRFLSGYVDLIEGKDILVTEDNSNSGQTAQMVYEALMGLKARSVHIGFVELDPHRIMYKQGLLCEQKGTYVSNYMHPDFQSAVGILPVARYLRHDYQLRKMYVWRLFDAYKEQ